MGFFLRYIFTCLNRWNAQPSRQKSENAIIIGGCFVSSGRVVCACLYESLHVRNLTYEICCFFNFSNFLALSFPSLATPSVWLSCVDVCARALAGALSRETETSLILKVFDPSAIDVYSVTFHRLNFSLLLAICWRYVENWKLEIGNWIVRWREREGRNACRMVGGNIERKEEKGLIPSNNMFQLKRSVKRRGWRSVFDRASRRLTRQRPSVTRQRSGV